MRPGMQRATQSPSFRFPFLHMGVVCSWEGPAGGCRGRLYLPTQDVLSGRHNNRLARDKGAGAGRRARPGGVGRQGSSAVGAGVETSSLASRLSTAFDPRHPPPPPLPGRRRPGIRCPGYGSLLSVPSTEQSAAPLRRRHGGVLEELAGQRRG